MGRIEELEENPEGICRESVVVLPSKKKIRRPLNLLVPLELDDDDFPTTINDGSHAVGHVEPDHSQTEDTPPRYNAQGKPSHVRRIQAQNDHDLDNDRSHFCE